MEDIIGRLKITLEMLKDGHAFKVGDVTLGVDEGNILWVLGISDYNDSDNLNKRIALRELEEVKLIFKEMINESEDLREFASNKIVKYNLGYGKKNGIGVCSEMNGVITWLMDLKD